MARFGSFFDGYLTRQDRACLGSFARHGHEVTLYAYDRLDLPPGVAWRDAGEILPRDRLYRAESGGHCGTVSQFTNHFRYVTIQQTGLIWIDTDVICLKRDWPERDWMIGWQDQSLANGAVLGAPRDHPALRQAIAVSEAVAGLSVWGLLGPHLITALAWEYDFAAHILPIETFYPVHFRDAPALLRPLAPGERMRISGGALSIHLWNEVLRKAGHDRSGPPPAGSALATLIDYAETI